MELLQLELLPLSMVSLSVGSLNNKTMVIQTAWVPTSDAATLRDQLTTFSAVQMPWLCRLA